MKQTWIDIKIEKKRNAKENIPLEDKRKEKKERV